MIYVFGECSLDTARLELKRSGQTMRVRAKVFAVLEHLIVHRERVVSKDELLQRLWSGQAVSDSALTSCVKEARQAVGDSGTEQRVVRTLHRQGYRFVASVQEIRDTSGRDAARPDAAAPASSGREVGTERGPVASDAPAMASATQHATAVVTGTKLEPQGEQKAVSVLVCGLADSAALTRDLGAEALHELQLTLGAMVHEVIERYGGTLLGALDDSFAAVFGAPVGHEDHVHRAIVAALRLRDGARRLQRAERVAAESSRSGLRVALHCGRVFVSPSSDAAPPTFTPIDDTVTLARRLQRSARTGTVVLSSAIQQGLRDQLQLRPIADEKSHDPAGGEVYDPGAAELVGLRNPLLRRRAFTAERRRALTPFVGRQAELAMLTALWEQTRANRGQIVGLVGELGVGKSRLLDEICVALGEAGAAVFLSDCVSYGQATPYLPLAGLVRQLAQVDASETREMAVAKISVLLDELALGGQAEAALIADVLGIAASPEEGSESGGVALDPGARKQRTFELLRRLLLRLAEREPLVIAVEDLHWIDATSNELLETVARAISGVPLLLLATYRPGYRPPWIDMSYATQQAVQPLTSQDATALVQRVVGDSALPDSLMGTILQQADGNPLFLEELARAALELGSADGPEQIPETLQAVVGARIDRLPPGAKHVIQVAAVVGRESPQALLCELAGLPDAELEANLQILRDSELLFAAERGGQTWYTFKHAMTQEGAYASLLTHARRGLHLRIAQALEQGFAEIAEMQPEVLARHLTAAGEIARAVPFWYQAGRRAVDRSANLEAVEHLQRGLELLASLPESEERDRQELALQIKLGSPLLMTRGHVSAEVAETYERVRALCLALGKTPQLFSEAAIDLVAARFDEALRAFTELGDIGRAEQDADFVLQSGMGIGFTLLHQGKIVEAEEHLRDSVGKYDAEQHHYLAFAHGHDPGPMCLIYDAHCLWQLGYPERALQRSTQAATLARTLGHPFSLAMILYMDAWHHSFHDDLAGTEARAAEALALCEEQEFPFWSAGATVMAGWVAARRGQHMAGIAQIRQGIAAWRATGAEVGVPYFFALLAEACLLAGRLEDGQQAVQEGLALRDTHGEHFYESELHRLRGTLLLAAGGGEVAEVCLAEALQVARSQQAKSLELRAATSLARLWSRRKRHQQARELLGETLAWFTEGHDTSDLRSAKQLLETLT